MGFGEGPGGGWWSMQRRDHLQEAERAAGKNLTFSFFKDYFSLERQGGSRQERKSVCCFASRKCSQKPELGQAEARYLGQHLHPSVVHISRKLEWK